MTIRALLFDLDDTLYEERHYAESGLAAVAAEIARRWNVDAGTANAALLKNFAGGREKIFDRTLPALGLPAGTETVARLVDVYRRHLPHIALYPGVRDMLARLKERFRIAIVTDGLPLMQQNKIAALELSALTDAVVYTWQDGHPKPDPAGFLAAAAKLGAPPAGCLVVGDDPDRDIAAASAAEMAAVRVRTGRFAARPNPVSAILASDIAAAARLEAVLAANSAVNHR
jgi:HAD superfamily hydrolase (TIGR01509 family)